MKSHPSVFWLLSMLSIFAPLLLAGPEEHAKDDEFFATIARLAPVTEVKPRAQVISATDRKKYGTFSSVIQWPHIPVSASNLPNGKIVTFASNKRNSFPVGADFTYAATYDPVSGQIVEINHNNHDMFCGHLVMLEDGRPYIMGGRKTVKHTSVFNWLENKWERKVDMNDGRWYPTATFLSGNNVMVASGSGGTNTVEVGTPEGGFKRLSSINWSGIAGASGFESNWWPLNFLAPNGWVFHAGPTDRMHWVNPNGNGQLIDSGKNVPGSWYPKHSAVAMYDKGKLIVAGGAANTGGGTTNRVYTVDLNGAQPIISTKASMKHPRRFQSGIMLPDGRFLVLGGNTSGAKFSDSGTVYETEIYDPVSNTWSVGADLAIPRNYHSVALLLPDGRVYVGGGGLNGTSPSNHPDAQIYSPGYFYNANGSNATRPTITAAPSGIRAGQTFSVTASANVQKFTMIRMTATTHGLSTDLRFLEIPHTKTGPTSFELTVDSNPNVLVGGYWMLWALDANGVPSVSKTIQVTRGNAPTLSNPGQQGSILSSAVSVKLNGDDADGDSLTYSATGLPTGVTLNPVSGVISGTPTAAGNFNVTATVADGVDGTATATFGWTVLATATVPTTGLTNHWEFENAQPATGTVNAQFLSGAGVVTDAERGQVLDFDGVNDYANFPVNVNEDGATYSFWMKSNTPNRGLFTVSKGDRGAGGHDRNIVLSGQDIGARMWTNESIASVEKTLADGNWHHVAYTHGPSNGGPRIQGLEYAYFEGEWNSLPDFRSIRPVKAGATSNFTLAPRQVEERFGFLYRGQVEINTAGTYTFFTKSDDGTKLWINGQLVVANDFLQAATERSGQITLAAGFHDIEVGFFEKTGQEFFEVSYAGPGISKTIIPDSKLWRSGGQRLFVDGHVVAQGSKVFSNVIDQDRVHLGFSPDGSNDYFKGQMDDFRIYNRALTGLEVVSLAEAEKVSNQPPLLTSPGNQITAVGEAVNLQLGASDPENQALTFSATSLPTGLSISSAGKVTGTTSVEGTYPTEFTVSDGQASVSKVISWEVRPSLSFPDLSGSPAIFGNSIGYTFGPNGGGRTYQVDWGDGSAIQTSSNGSFSHSYAAPGRYEVSITLTDDAGQTATTTFTQTVHGELTENAPGVSQSVIYTSDDRVWNVNPDNHSVTVTNAATLQKITEVNVSMNPRSLAEAPGNQIWVTAKNDDVIQIIRGSDFQVASTISLARGSTPHGIVINQTGDTAYVALEGTGEVAVIDVASETVVDRINVGPDPRHLSINHDGTKVFVSRFISPRINGEETAAPNPGTTQGGEVVVLEKTGATLTVSKTVILQNSTRADAADAARGIPNYLGPLAISPDNSQGWLASKQDNLERGQGRDGQLLNHDRTVRSVSSRIDLATETESESERIDHDNAGIAVSSIFGPKGNFVYVALEGSRDVAVIDAFGGAEINRFQTGRAPQGLAISPDGKTLFVHNFMSRNVTAHDVTEIIDGIGDNVPKLATIDTVASEALAADVLLGKQHFYDAEDVRLALQEYMSCASCHSDGGHDGRVWDLTQFGEGLRNTIDLRGKANHGALHWTANFDEVHDFEGQIRALSGGEGFLTNAQFSATSDPFGAPKAGLSPDLDALAAYVTSLSTVGLSPFRGNSGDLTSAGVEGKLVFENQQCAACHEGENFSDSDGATRHDIGIGLLADTPTLRGLWNSAPYLHDGRAATLEAAVAAHAGVNLTGVEMTNLTSYLLQIDRDEPAAKPVEVSIEAGPNLFSNPGFENDLTDWNTWNPVTIVSSASAGNKAAQLSESLVVQAFEIQPGKEYELFGKAKTSGDTWRGFGITFFDLDGNTVKDEDSSEFTSSAEFEEFSLTATAPAGAKIASVWFWCSAGGTLTLDELVMRTPGVEGPDPEPEPVGPTANLFTATTTVTAPFSVEARFSEDVTGVTVSDFTVTNGTASGLSSTSAKNYFVTVTPTSAGQVSISVPAAAAKNLANVDSQASNQLLVSYQDTPPPAGQPESDTYTITSGVKQNVTFLGSFNSPVVFATIEADASMPPMVARVHNVTSAGYELTLQRLDGLAAAVEDVRVHTFVLEEGVYSLGVDGARMEVGKIDLVDSSSAWNGFSFGSEVTPQQSYTNPVVIGQMQTSFSDHWVQFWSRGDSVSEPFKAGDSKLMIGHHTGEDPDTWVPFIESAGYLIIEAGRGTLKGIPYEAGLSPKAGEVDVDDSFEIPASGTMPVVAKTLLSIEGMQNEDGGLPILRSATVDKVTVKIDEDQLADDEREHGREAVGWLMLGQ